MPKGIPNATRPNGPTPPVLRINLRAEDYDRLQELARDNYRTTELQAGYTGWTISEPLDAVFISQIYHDFFYPQLNVDVPAFNRAVFDALKPGGVLVIIDHSAEPGHTIDLNPQTDLHRIDQAQVIREVTAAGFVLEEESQILRNPADNRTERVFEGDIRGHTDQFVLRFRKPAN